MSSGLFKTQDGVEIFYKDWGTGQPIVFHHGWPLSSDDWDAQMLFFLAQGYRVIAHDRRGHGRSTQTDIGNEMDTYAADVAALAAHLDLKDAIHVGHSTGGGEVARYVAQYGSGGRVAKAVLIGAVPPIMLKTPANPGGLPIDAGVLFAVASSAAYAVYIVLTRMVARRDSTATSMVYVGLVGLVLTTAVGVFYWKPMDPFALGLMVTLMVTMCVSHGLMMKALSLAPASLLQPFNYLALPWGITLSFVVFGHLIDPISLAGAAVIAGAGLVVMARERRKAATPAGSAEVLGPRE